MHWTMQYNTHYNLFYVKDKYPKLMAINKLNALNEILLNETCSLRVQSSLNAIPFALHTINYVLCTIYLHTIYTPIMCTELNRV